MKKIFNKKRILYLLLPVVALAFIAGVPIDDDKTLLQQLIAAFPSGEADEAQQERSQKSLDDVWDEIQKISANNGEDTVMLTGKIRLVDNADEEGIKEQQNFIIKQAGNNQWFHLDSFDRVQFEETLFMINHTEKEIVIQPSGVADSMMNALKMMDPKQFKKLLVKDGTIAEISVSGTEKTLTITPGLMDAVNRYEIIYDATTYQVKKFRIYYTSIPYQNYLENDRAAVAEKQAEETEASPQTEEGSDPEAIEADITEYMLEFEIDRKEKGCDMDFLDNVFYKIQDNVEVIFVGKLEGYKKIRIEDLK
jgi:hypothetical protein